MDNSLKCQKVEPSSACIGCDSKEIEKVAEIKSNQYYFLDRNLYHAFQCKECGLLFINPMPTPEFLQKHYNSAFDHDHHFLPRRKKEDQEIVNEMIALAIQGSGKKLDEINYYEIGVGSGLFANMVFKTGVNVRGCELSGNMALKNNPFPVDLGGFENQGYEKKFDIVYTSHVLEHSPDPAGLLKAIHKSLNLNGIAVVRVPNQNASYFHFAGLLLGKDKWDTLLPVPDHLTLFSKKSLNHLFKKNGFKVEKISTNPFINNECSLLISYLSITTRAFILKILPLCGKKLESSSVVVKRKDGKFNPLGRFIIKLSYYMRPLDSLLVFFIWPLYKKFDLGEDLYCIARKREA